ncbi:MAG: DEAD/DEAH box helicase [Alphaproteobacteria bacterium]|nr:DEAD/DEAH box helicase [Alphaproteobacteria bacterium]
MDGFAVRSLIEEIFDPATIKRASVILAEGKIIRWQKKAIGEDRFNLSGKVRGSQAQTYETSVEISGAPNGRLDAACDCTCPVGYDCKHAAALLALWSRAEEGGGRAEQTQPSPSQATLEPVPSALREWLAKLEAKPEPPRLTPRQDKHVAYQLTRGYGPGWRLGVGVLSTPRTGRWRFSKPQTNFARAAQAPQYVTAEDIDLVRRYRLMAESDYSFGSGWGVDLAYGPGFEALRDTVATGRAYLEDETSPLVWIEAVEGRLAWRRIGSARAGEELRLILFDASQPEGSAPELLVLPTTPLVCLDPHAHRLGPLKPPLDANIALRLFSIPLVPVACVDLLDDMLPEAIRALLPALPVKRKVIRHQNSPRPMIRIGVQTMVVQASQLPNHRSRHNYWQSVQTEQLVGDVVFELAQQRYTPNWRPGWRPGQAGGDDVLTDDGVFIHRHVRDPKAESARIAQLSALGLHPFHDRPGVQPPSDGGLGIGWAVGLSQEEAKAKWLSVLPALSAQGWGIELSPESGLAIDRLDDGALALEWRPATASGLDAAKGSGSSAIAAVGDDEDRRIDWFDTHIGARINGAPVDLAPVIMQWLRTAKPSERQSRLAGLLDPPSGAGPMLLPMTDGRLVSVNPAALYPVIEALLALFSPREIEEGSVRVQSARLAEAAEIEGLREAMGGWASGSRPARLVEAIRSWRERPAPALPDWFAAALRPYQVAGVTWMAMLADAGLGGCLADDMGLGKTVQTLAWLAALKAMDRLSRPALIIAPTSVVPNWAAEAEKYAPGLRVATLTGSDRALRFDAVSEADLVLSSYALLPRDIETLAAQDWSLVALDEAQMIRNPATAVAKAARRLKADQKLALSGTPVENHLGDLWSLMTFLNPGLLGDAKQFASDFRKPIEAGSDPQARTRLARRIGPFLLRRTRGDVVAELPDRTELSHLIALHRPQQDLYEATRATMQRRVQEALDAKGLMQSSIVILDALLKLRQCCCDPRLVPKAPKAAREGGSAKLDRLMEMLLELKAEGRKVLVFSQFVSMLDLIRAQVIEAGLSHEWLTGSSKDRAGPVKRFQNGEADLFLISLKAGGAGLNLTAADTVILFDPWWNPAVEAQAIGRAHRIGQQRPVFVHRLIAQGTIEEKMTALQARKRDIANAIWDGEADGSGGGLAGLDTEDVLALFA